MSTTTQQLISVQLSGSSKEDGFGGSCSFATGRKGLDLAGGAGALVSLFMD